MEALVHQEKVKKASKAKQTQNFARIHVIMLIIVICLLMENKYLSLKPTIKMLTFQHIFVSEAFLMDLVLQILEKYL